MATTYKDHFQKDNVDHLFKFYSKCITFGSQALVPIIPIHESFRSRLIHEIHHCASMDEDDRRVKALLSQLYDVTLDELNGFLDSSAGGLNMETCIYLLGIDASIGNNETAIRVLQGCIMSKDWNSLKYFTETAGLNIKLKYEWHLIEMLVNRGVIFRQAKLIENDSPETPGALVLMKFETPTGETFWLHITLADHQTYNALLHHLANFRKPKLTNEQIRAFYQTFIQPVMGKWRSKVNCTSRIHHTNPCLLELCIVC